MVECRTPEREVRGSRPTSAMLCPWARHFTPRKYWLITQEAMAPSRHDWKIVDRDVKPQHNQPICIPPTCLFFCQTLRLLPYFMCVNSEGSGKTAWMRRLGEPSLVTYVIRRQKCVSGFRTLPRFFPRPLTCWKVGGGGGNVVKNAISI